MATSHVDKGNWISRFLALVLAIVAGIWLFEFSKTVPNYSDALTLEKGVYQGPSDAPIGTEGFEALEDRSRGQLF